MWATHAGRPPARLSFSGLSPLLVYPATSRRRRFCQTNPKKAMRHHTHRRYALPPKGGLSQWCGRMSAVPTVRHGSVCWSSGDESGPEGLRSLGSPIMSRLLYQAELRAPRQGPLFIINCFYGFGQVQRPVCAGPCGARAGTSPYGHVTQLHNAIKVGQEVLF